MQPPRTRRKLLACSWRGGGREGGRGGEGLAHAQGQASDMRVWARLELDYASFGCCCCFLVFPTEYLFRINLSPGGRLPCEPLCVRTVHYRPVRMEIIPRNVKGINSPGKGR